MNLSEYSLVYDITILPHVLFAGVTNILEPFKFEDLDIPIDCKERPIDCRFMIFNKEGELIEYAIETAMFLNVNSILNVTPLKMLEKIIKNHTLKE